MSGSLTSNFPISLYFHVPFCKQKCEYCHFYVIPDKPPLKIDYMQGLALEWEYREKQLLDKEIVSIYFGGGTPSLLGPDYIHEILSWVRRFNWQSKEIEITLEANPEDIDLGMMKQYHHAGVNRVSIGVQSLEDSLLHTLTRKHNAQKAKDAVWKVKNSGIENISIDLMYDLPQQTMDHWKKTLDTALALPITHLSLYNLVFEKRTVFYQKRSTLQPLLPDENTSAQMYLEAVEKCQHAGLIQYEISAFQKSGYYSRHNTGYWQGRPFLGFGPSAFSYWHSKRFRNVPHLGKYLSRLTEGQIPLDYEEELEHIDKLRELLAINIRLLEGVDLNLFQQKHGLVDVDTLSCLNKLVTEGFLTFQKGRYQLTQRGILFYDTVASEIV
jgi:oxygen-independent coproporphyrinogen-3 oxidase